MHPINIVNRKTAVDPPAGTRRHYCGRGTPLGNPFRMRDESDREYVCRQYESWFGRNMANKQGSVYKQFKEILESCLKGPVELECYCAPKRCHCETIRKALIRRIQQFD